VIEVGLAESEAVGAWVAPTVTTAFAVALPPVPVQVMEYEVDCVGETVAEPEVVLLVENPEPVQLVAFVEDHVSVEDCPEVIEVGLAVSEAVGTTAFTVTVALAFALPPAPVHVTEYVVVTVGETVALPEVPEAEKLVPEQEVALVEDQVSVDD
jgi:hypothetical protein